MRIYALFLTLVLASSAHAQTYVRFSKGDAVDAFGSATTPVSARDNGANYCDPASGGNFCEGYSQVMDLSAFNSIQITIRLYKKSGATFVAAASSTCHQVYSVQMRTGPRRFTVQPTTAGYYARLYGLTAVTTSALENGQVFVPLVSYVEPTTATINIDNGFAVFRLIQSAYQAVGTDDCYAHVQIVPSALRDSNILSTSRSGETVHLAVADANFLLFGSGYATATGVDGVHTLRLQNNGTKPIVCGTPGANIQQKPASIAVRGVGPHFMLAPGAADYDGTGASITLNGYVGLMYCHVYSSTPGDYTYLSYFGY